MDNYSKSSLNIATLSKIKKIIDISSIFYFKMQNIYSSLNCDVPLLMPVFAMITV